MTDVKYNSHRIVTWRQFAKHVRSKGCNLLKRLDSFPNSVLVTGCQRSGTTIMSRVIAQSDEMVKYYFGRDDELDAALILSGYVEHSPQGRYCFQTTYLNECYKEYFVHSNNGHKIIWVLRNPYSVVYSLVYHWRRFALNELFRACGVDLLNEKEKKRYDLIGIWGVSKLRRACLSYNGKVSQAFELAEKLGKDQLFVVEYDKLVKNKKEILPAIYKFIDLPYKEKYGDKIHGKSLDKAKKLSEREQVWVEEFCMPVYDRAVTLCSHT